MSGMTTRLMRDLEQGLAESRAGQVARVPTAVTIQARRVGRLLGSKAAQTKLPVKLRFDPDVLEGLRGSGDGWQTRINNMLRASLRLAGRLPG